MSAPAHFFTVDVEEHYQVSALEPFVPRSQWDSEESRVERNTDSLLELLAQHDTVGTFFTLGMVAERHPGLIRRIVDAGHELASHGWDHRRVTDETPEQFRLSVRRARAVLEDLGGVVVQGYRAPSFSIVEGREWALNILVEEGYAYDSSLFPVRRRGYGYPSGGRDPYWLTLSAGKLMEFPPATIRRLGQNLPAAGGAYFRLLPGGLVRAGLREATARGAPATFYIHPWEIDAGQQRYPVPLRTRIRHYGRLATVRHRLAGLLAVFQFTAIRDGIPSLGLASG